MSKTKTLLIGTVLFSAGCTVPTLAPTSALINTPTTVPEATETDQNTCRLCAEDYAATQTIIDAGSQDDVHVRWMPNFTELILLRTNRESGMSAIEFYNPADWNLVRSLSLSTVVTSLDVSPDGNRLLTGRQIIATETGDVLLSFEPDNMPVAFSPDGKWLVGLGPRKGSPANRFIIWDAQTGEQHADLGLINETSFLIQPDEKSIAIFDVNGNWTQWDLTSGEYIGLFDEFADKDFTETAWTYSPDETLLVTGGWGEQTPPIVKIFVTSTKTLELTIEPKIIDSIDNLIFSPNGNVLAVQTFRWENATLLLDVRTGRMIKYLPLRSYSQVLFTPDSKNLIWSGDDGKVRQWPLPAEP